MAKFGRVAELYVKDRVIRYPELDMRFNIDFDTDSDGNTGEITVYNLSDKTIDKLKKGNVFRIKAGYKDNVGLLLNGVIDSSTSKFKSGSKETEIIVNDNMDAWLKTKINKTWKAGAKTELIAKDIIDQIPLTLGDFDIPNPLNYSKGKTFSCTAKKALEELVKDASVKLHISRGKIYFRPKDKANREVLTLNKDNGLIASPQRIDQESEDRWKVQSLLNYRIEPDVILDIASQTANGLYRVVQGSHVCNSRDFITEAEVVKYRNK